ncbi:type II toxin-antitoxin system RnlA family toxin [Pseudomonas sp. GCM10022188]|uniref:type II toxin-antitoxin system RnlA family toxin n=1 Tax=Pseudomonas TaxID=286 RepID=UPI001E2D9216|nr:type II toxin-antitoxin system RnlA family toxin [Pseudomonas oryzagri]MCC6074041.1 type II toxin-antitoxin system RnlA family toxin [Pseudomonas oryzagri]
MKIFPVKGGAYALGKASPTKYDPEVYEFFAEKISCECTTAQSGSLNYSIPKLGRKPLEELIAFLQEEGAEIEGNETNGAYDLYRLLGPKGDRLTIKIYKNDTVQFQGKHLHLATLLIDYLVSVLSLEDALNKQIEIYSVPLTISQVKEDLEARIPVSHTIISDAVRASLSSALAMTKITLPLEDHSAVAFPALRALEGFLKDILVRGGLSPKVDATFGDYVRDGRMGGDYAKHVGNTIESIFNNLYCFYHANRHRLFHMDAPSTTSRLLNFSDSVAIVNRVLELIESSCLRLTK